jgi:hypothetical protein
MCFSHPLFIKKRGQTLYNCQNISHFTDSLARIEADNEKYGFINRHGEIVSPCVFDFAYCFSEGFACVTEYNKRWKEDRWLYQGVPFKYCKFINTRGEFVTNSFDDARSFQEGLAAVKVCGRWGFINTHGEIVCQCKWDEVKDFQEGMAPVKKEGRWGCVNESGDIVVPCVWKEISGFVEGLSAVEGFDFFETFINKKGEIIGEHWQCVGVFENGLAGVHNWDGKEYYINKKGDVVCEAGIRVV